MVNSIPKLAVLIEMNVPESLSFLVVKNIVPYRFRVVVENGVGSKVYDGNNVLYECKEFMDVGKVLELVEMFFDSLRVENK